MRFFLILLGISVAMGHKTYQKNIPNGERIQHPCKPNYIWEGVGHQSEAGGGPWNPFGEDFKAANHVWTKELCQTDSDGDGKSNGVELGDPNCTWKKGEQPSRLTDISHPGVCEPWDRPACAGKQEWMVEACQPTEFKCDAINEPGVMNVTVALNKEPVPAKETTYRCIVFDAPTTDDVHLIATEGFIDNKYVMHHIALFGCHESVQTTTTPYECGMVPHPKCNNLLSSWIIGKAGDCMHKDAGFRLGGTAGFKRLALQYHWNNPMLRRNYTDSSGMVLYYTANKRVHDAAILLTGTEFLEIPPKKERVVSHGSCPSDCTQRDITGSIFVTDAMNHMHYLGISQKIEIWRDGQLKKIITNEPSYSFDSPEIYKFEPPIEILPGDAIKTECVFRSTHKLTTTYWGDSLSQEMCYGVLTFFPAQNMTLRFCSSWLSLNPCKKNPLDDCPVFLSNFQESALYKNITSKCNRFPSCREECLEAVLDAKKDPCMQGDLWKKVQYSALISNKPGQNFLAALSSCSVEVFRAENPDRKPPTGASSVLTPSILTVLATFAGTLKRVSPFHQ